MRFAVDANVLLYAESLGDSERAREAQELADHLPANTVIAAQALGEVFRVLIRKGKRSRAAAHAAALQWRNRFSVAAVTEQGMIEALDLASAHALGIRESVHLAAAAAAGCEVFLSEDFQNGFRWRGVMVVNPFLKPRHPLLEWLCEEGE